METMHAPEARIPNIAGTVPEALDALLALAQAASRGGVPQTTRLLVDLRASQINGCSVCVELHARELHDLGVPAPKIWAVGAWRESPHFDPAERAALALAEAGTRLADGPDPVPDAVWDEAARHYDERQLASLVLSIASINTWNRLNAITRQPAGAWVREGDA